MRKRVREFERDGSGSSHRREATHTYRKALTHSLVGTRLWDRDITLGLLYRMCCLTLSQSSRVEGSAQSSFSQLEPQ